ncbi:lysylphosphatidylglycerol synthase transmembrane domain-containing protein [Halopelagius fulvigenes]|uniref:Lysylphosphatidylglycerol synthase transmembrane domain-containing protein n=1 Tax=Halopelagius fulvigenes TaxID=1198324 RepID=A0ABD5TZY1_9EURY
MGESAFDRRTAVKSLVGFAVAAALLYTFGYVLGWQSIISALSSADPVPVVVACGCSLVALSIWTKGWDVVLSSLSVEIPYRRLVPTYLAATFADYVTPFGKAGGGPFVAAVLSTDRDATYEESLASVVTTDALNLLPFFSFAGVGVVALGLTGSVPRNVRPLVYGLGAIAVFVPVFAYLVWRVRDRAILLIPRVLEPVAARVGFVEAAEIEERTARFFSLLGHLGARRAWVAETLLFAYVGWAFFALPLWLAARAVGVSLPIQLVAFIVPASAMASLLPTPGGLGGVEAAVTGLLVALAGVPTATAAAIALLYRVASFWFVLPVGGGATLWIAYRS